MPFPRIPEGEWATVSQQDKERGLLESILLCVDLMDSRYTRTEGEADCKAYIHAYVDSLWDCIQQDTRLLIEQQPIIAAVEYKRNYAAPYGDDGDDGA